ncbi:MAG: hypothetical protein KJS68_14620, partial [Alphaproteobacteria bacterium]|nr:hypothetical protein [Alphaproteobacteria bacterium]
MTPVANAPRRYFIELMLAMALYAAALFVRHGWFHHTGDPELRLVIMLLPILPVFLAALAIYRFYYRMDEMHRLQTLESLAFSAGVTALFAISW